MKAKKYFDKEYGNDHIKNVVDLKDMKSLYGLMQEYAEEQLRLHIISQQRELLIHYNSFVNMQYHGISLDNDDIESFLE
jgi:hypothetical protein